MKKYKKLLSTIIIIFILLLLIIIVLLVFRNKEVEKSQSNFNIIQENHTIESNRLNNSTNTEDTNKNDNQKTEFYAISKIITDYYNAVFNVLNIKPKISMGGISEDDLVTIKQNYKKQLDNIYNVLSDEYINGNYISLSNIESKMEEKNMATVKITSVKKLKESENIKVFYVLADLKDVNTFQIIEKEHLIYLDEKNGTYSITLDSYIKQKYTNLPEDVNVYVPPGISKKQNNEYTRRKISDDEYTKDLISDLMYNLIFKKENSYRLLDEKYKNIKFQNINDYYKFISNNEEDYRYLYRNLTGDTTGLNNSEELQKYRIEKLKYGISQYEVKEYGNYKQYLIKDKQNKYYIINEKGPMEYSVLLDSYSVETVTINEKFDKLNEDKKSEFLISQYIEMINLKDYQSAYNRLEDMVKNSMDIVNFTSFIKERFFDNNFVESIQQISNTNGVKKYVVSLKENEYGNEVKSIKISLTATNKDYKVAID